MTWQALRDSAFILLSLPFPPHPFLSVFPMEPAPRTYPKPAGNLALLGAVSVPNLPSMRAGFPSRSAPATHRYSSCSAPRSGTNSDDSRALPRCSVDASDSFLSAKKMPLWSRSTTSIGARDGDKGAPATCRK